MYIIFYIPRLGVAMTKYDLIGRRAFRCRQRIRFNNVIIFDPLVIRATRMSPPVDFNVVMDYIINEHEFPVSDNPDKYKLCIGLGTVWNSSTV